MERQLIETVEQAEALVGQLVKFEWYDMWEADLYTGVVSSYNRGTQRLTVQAADRSRLLIAPYSYEPVYATVFHPGCDMQTDPRPIPRPDGTENPWEPSDQDYGDSEDDLDDLLVL